MVVLGNSLKSSMAEQPADAIRVDELDHYNDDWIPPFNLREMVTIRTNQKLSDFYELYEEIGEGKFGQVHRCLEKSTGLELAAKCIKLKKDADLSKVEKEINIMTQMRHKCIAQIYDAFANSSNEIVLIMEIVSGGELFDRVVDDSYILTETAVAMIMYQILEAIKYIHSQKIIHLDLKPENIMCVSAEGNQVKLIDFGLAQYYDGQQDLLFMAGTPEFAAPEVIKYEPLDFHTDMWSLGVISYILLSGQSPFLGDNIALTYCNVEKGNWSFSEEFEENGISEEAKGFITKLLIVDKSKRMLPDECLQHPWIVNSLVRARNKSLKEKPIDIAKLRSYVKNKRFRRLVFGVLFINSVTRMMTTLSARKSENGIQYVKNMLNATVENGGSMAVQSLVKSAFTKRRRNATGEAQPEIIAESLPIEKPSTSQEGEELHRKPKRKNHAPTEPNQQTGPKQIEVTELQAIDSPNTSKLENKTALNVPSQSESSSPEASRTASPKLIKRQRDKANRPKSASSRKASSSEQAAKKPKQGSGSGLKLEVDSIDKSHAEIEPKRVESTSKVSGILAKFQQIEQSTSTFTLPVACALIPPKKQSDVESSVKVVLTKPEIQNGDIPSNEEKIPKLKKIKKVGSVKKTKSTTIDLTAAKDDLKPTKMEPTTRNSSVNPPMLKDDGKPTSLVSALLQRLERNEAPPMVLAVSSFVPTPKIESAKLETKKSKVLRIEPIKGDEKAVEVIPTVRVLSPDLEKKVVSERKTRIKKKDEIKEKSNGDLKGSETEREAKSECELSVRQKTIVDKTGALTCVENRKMRLANSVTSNEKGEVKQIGEDSKHLAEKTVENTSSLDLQKSIKEGKKLRKKHLAVSDEETTRAGLEATVSSKRLVKKVSINGEKKKIQRATAITEDGKASVHVESKKTVGFSSDSPSKSHHTSEIHCSIDDDVAAFKALMNKRNARKAQQTEDSPIVNNAISKVDKHPLKASKSLQFDDDDENDDDSLIQAQQDAFDFSVLKAKLESRLTGGRRDSDSDNVFAHNSRQKLENMAEIRSKLTDTGNIKRAMNKWIELDKQTSDQHK